VKSSSYKRWGTHEHEVFTPSLISWNSTKSTYFRTLFDALSPTIFTIKNIVWQVLEKY